MSKTISISMVSLLSSLAPKHFTSLKNTHSKLDRISIFHHQNYHTKFIFFTMPKKYKLVYFKILQTMYRQSLLCIVLHFSYLSIRQSLRNHAFIYFYSLCHGNPPLQYCHYSNKHVPTSFSGSSIIHLPQTCCLLCQCLMESGRGKFIPL